MLLAYNKLPSTRLKQTEIDKGSKRGRLEAIKEGGGGNQVDEKKGKTYTKGQAWKRKKEGKPVRVAKKDREVLRELLRKDNEVLRELLRKDTEVPRELSQIYGPP